MSSSVPSVLFSSKAELLICYFVFLWLCVFHVQGFIHSLLLETWINRYIRERTGPVLAGGGLGGIPLKLLYKLYIQTKLQSVPVAFLIFFLLCNLFLSLLLWELLFFFFFADLFFLLTFSFSLLVFSSLPESSNLAVFDCICFILNNQAFFLWIWARFWASKDKKTSPVQIYQLGWNQEHFLCYLKLKR